MTIPAGINHQLLNQNRWPIPLADLLALWTFEDQSGTTVTDVSGNGHNGTLDAAGLWDAVGVVGGGVETDGANRIVMPAGGNWIGMGNTHTFFCWYNPDALSETCWLLDMASNISGSVAADNRGFQALYVGGTNTFVARIFYDSTTSAYGLTGGRWDTGLTAKAGEWNLFILDRTLTQARAWVYNSDGVSSASQSYASNAIRTTSASSNILAYQGGGSLNHSTSGKKVDCMGMASVLLTASQRNRLWNNGVGVQP